MIFTPTPILGLPLIEAAQLQKHLPINEALARLDALTHLAVASRSENAPPSSPAEGERWIVGPDPTGDWSAHAGEIAIFQNGGWIFVPPVEGMAARISDEGAYLLHDGADWTPLAGEAALAPALSLLEPLTPAADQIPYYASTSAAALASLTPFGRSVLGASTGATLREALGLGSAQSVAFEGLGLGGSTADATNRFAVSTPAALFNHAGAGVQLKLNKAAAADTASLLFQTNWSGRAEMGLAGSNDWSLKTSADGSSWVEALKVAAATGDLTLATDLGVAHGGTGASTAEAARTNLGVPSSEAVTILHRDALRQSVEAATGGRNTVLYDDVGNPSVMVVIPAFNIQDVDASLGTGLHPAFLMGGVEKREIFIGKYLASTIGTRAVSLPGVDPSSSLDFEAARARCAAKGAGWHLMTNAEWAALGLWSWKNGTMPRGNTNYGRDHQATHETSRRSDLLAPGLASGNARNLTGSGPSSWSHDGTGAGVTDLGGNLWEWAGGLRLLNGEIQIIPNNDAAATGADQSAASALWWALLPSGALVAPGTAGSLKYDASGANGSGNPILSSAVTSQSNGSTSSARKYGALTAASGVDVPPIAKLLGIFPHVTGIERGNLYVRNAGERLPRRGGSWSYGGNAGVFALDLLSARLDSNANFGFRPAFIA